MVAENYKEVMGKVQRACERSGRDAGEVTLIAVSKTKPVSMIREAMEAGARVFGENKAQELCEKYEELPKDLHWHMIGHLQRNKVKYLVERAELIHSVDSLRLAKEIQKEAEKCNVTCPVLIEINIGGEESKDGIPKEGAIPLIREIAELSRVQVRGLMTIAPPVEEPEEARGYFKEMRTLFEAVKAEQIPGVEMKELSMGMTGDFEVAIEEGATMVRVGTAIFGERQYAL